MSNPKVIKDNRKKLDAIIKQFHVLNGKKVHVGIFIGTRRERGSMATIAATHEYGSVKKNIPARPSQSKYFDNNTREIMNFILKNIKGVTGLEFGSKMALDRIGVWYTGKLKLTIRQLTTPVLSAKTIARKKSTKLLIDTGQMLNAIRHKISRGQI